MSKTVATLVFAFGDAGDNGCTNARANHLTRPLSDFERMTDAELSQITLYTESPAETRARLKDARDKGYEFLPCGCANVSERGECLGWDFESDKERE